VNGDDMLLDWAFFLFILTWVSFAAFMPVFCYAIDANLSISIPLPLGFHTNCPA
jgi:hypothetical protein